MQTKYRNTNKKTVDNELKEARRRRNSAVYTKAFHTRQKFGAASKVRTIYKKFCPTEIPDID